MSSEPYRSYGNSDNIFEFMRTQSKTGFDDAARKFRDQSSAVGNWPIQEAYLGLLLAAAEADGRIVEDERIELQTIARLSRVLRPIEGNQLNAMAGAAKERLKTPNGLKEACESLPGPLRMSVFANCVDVILADRDFQAVEEDFLRKLITLLDLPSSEATMMIESLLIKNRF